MITNKSIKGLLHQTSLENFERIIRTGAIITEMERFKLELCHHSGMQDYYDEDDEIFTGQYPGVYMRAYTDYHHSKNIDYSIGDVVFVFNVELLSRNDYHINTDDNCGIITNNTYLEYCKEINDQIEYDCHEFVFHHFVPLKYVAEIWFKNIICLFKK